MSWNFSCRIIVLECELMWILNNDISSTKTIYQLLTDNNLPNEQKITGNFVNELRQKSVKLLQILNFLWAQKLSIFISLMSSAEFFSFFSSLTLARKFIVLETCCTSIHIHVLMLRVNVVTVQISDFSILICAVRSSRILSRKSVTREFDVTQKFVKSLNSQTRERNSFVCSWQFFSGKMQTNMWLNSKKLSSLFFGWLNPFKVSWVDIRLMSLSNISSLLEPGSAKPRPMAEKHSQWIEIQHYSILNIFKLCTDSTAVSILRNL